MAKLLEFRPDGMLKPEKKSDFGNQLTVDVCYGCTPDLPRLRFAGPQMVFIWDNMKNAVLFNKMMDVSQSWDWHVSHYSVVTKDEYVPFENTYQGIGEHQYFLPADKDWTDKVDKEQVSQVMKQPARQVTGRIIQANVKTIQAMDRFYGNRENFVRQLIPVKIGGDTLWVWAYTCPLRSIGKYNPHAMVYQLRGGIKPIPIKQIGTGSCVTYEVDAYRTHVKVG